MSLIIGSTAIKHYFEDFPRKPKDLDVVVATKKVLTNNRVNNTEFLENPIILKYQSDGYLEPNLMLTLKMSHLFWDINWNKHLFDVQFLLKKGCQYNLDILRELREYWEDVLPKIRRSDLKQGKEEFFTNRVNKNTEDHDFLHTLIAEVPAYTKILKDGAEVELDENKWNNLSFEEKCDVVREEAYVMAIERYKNKLHYVPAYKRQLEQNIQRHFSEFVALFAIENYILLEKPKFNYFKKVGNELQTSV